MPLHAKPAPRATGPDQEIGMGWISEVPITQPDDASQADRRALRLALRAARLRLQILTADIDYAAAVLKHRMVDAAGAMEMLDPATRLFLDFGEWQHAAGAVEAVADKLRARRGAAT
jgi:hypothetical protein